MYYVGDLEGECGLAVATDVSRHGIEVIEMSCSHAIYIFVSATL